MDLIHPNRAAAIAACHEFNARLDALMAELGVWVENEDSCSPSWTYAKYYAEDGKTVKTISL
jgi:hypothetical protein